MCHISISIVSKIFRWVRLLSHFKGGSFYTAYIVQIVIHLFGGSSTGPVIVKLNARDEKKRADIV